MTRLEKQKRLNREIATELDKYQVILEYGRLFLDRDKQIRDNYKWISYAKKGCLTGGCIDLIVALLTAFISSELFEKYYVYMIIVLVLTIIIYIAIIFINRKKIAQKLNDVDKNQLIKLLDNLQDYLFMLGEWMKEVDSHIEQEKKILDIIEKDLVLKKGKQANEVNSISHIQGNIDNAMDAEARRLATLRLEQFKYYLYE